MLNQLAHVSAAKAFRLATDSKYREFVSRLFVEYHSWANQPQRLAELLSLPQRAGFRVQVQTDHCAASPFLGADISDGMDLRLNIFATQDQPD